MVCIYVCVGVVDKRFSTDETNNERCNVDLVFRIEPIKEYSRWKENRDEKGCSSRRCVGEVERVGAEAS